MTLIRVSACFVNADGSPLAGGSRAKLWDKDAFSDDLLCESEVGVDGKVAFLCDLADASSGDSPGETMPDLYIQILRGGKEIFRTPIIKDADFFRRDTVTRMRESQTLDLGTFTIIP